MAPFFVLVNIQKLREVKTLARKGKDDHLDTPERRFMLKFMEEWRKTPGMTVRVERMPQGSMHGYVLKYISASNLDPQCLKEGISGWMGNSHYFLRFVDEGGRPLEEFGSKWMHLAYEYG